MMQEQSLPIQAIVTVHLLFLTLLLLQVVTEHHLHQLILQHLLQVITEHHLQLLILQRLHQDPSMKHKQLQTLSAVTAHRNPIQLHPTPYTALQCNLLLHYGQFWLQFVL